MLKIIYLEEEIYLEHLPQSIEAWKTERILLNLRAGISIHSVPSIASLVLPVDIYCLKSLVRLAEQAILEIAPCDEGFIEVILTGTWIAHHEDSEVGIFICELDESSETLLYQLWQQSQLQTSVASD